MKLVEDKIAVAARVATEGRTSAGLIVPAAAESDQFASGEVTAIGLSVFAPVTVGSRVHFNRFTASRIKVDGRDYYIIRVADVLAVE